MDLLMVLLIDLLMDLLMDLLVALPMNLPTDLHYSPKKIIASLSSDSNWASKSVNATRIPGKKNQNCIFELFLQVYKFQCFFPI